MPAGIIINDQNLNTTFDGTQRIPKILAEVKMNKGDVTKTVVLPRPIKGNIYYYFQSNAVESEPYYNPMQYNFTVSSTNTTVTVTYVKVYDSLPTVPNPFTVYVGEY